tara:strand:+ start:1653 stop:2207 length:555 start_codon:yes stop_codon:yes gene_type:complete
MKTVAIIPARGGSKRLFKKNIQKIWGQPMIYWPIQACLKCSQIDDVFVSSDDDEILKISANSGAKTIKRSLELAGDRALKQLAVIDALDQINKKYDLVVSAQANSPELKSRDLASAIDKLIKYDRNEIISIDKELVQHGAFRVWRYEYAFTKALSYRTACYLTNYKDIHTQEDLDYTEKNRTHD